MVAETCNSTKRMVVSGWMTGSQAVRPHSALCLGREPRRKHALSENMTGDACDERDRRLSVGLTNRTLPRAKAGATQWVSSLGPSSGRDVRGSNQCKELLVGGWTTLSKVIPSWTHKNPLASISIKRLQPVRGISSECLSHEKLSVAQTRCATRDRRST